MNKEKKPNELAAHSASMVNGAECDVCNTQYTIDASELQSLYYEVNGETGNKKSKNRSWAKKKAMSELLASSYFRLSLEYQYYLNKGYTKDAILSDYGLINTFGTRGASVIGCGDLLEFRMPVTGGKWKLHHASFCKDRLCPLCMARRSLKIYSQLNRILNYLDTENYEYLFLTVTVPNCSGDVLENVCDRILKSFTNLLRRKELKSLVKGYFRSLEVTFNHNPYSKSFKTFHPHLHAILAVPKSYFKTFYIKQSEWLRMWQEVYGDDSIRFVNIKKVNASQLELDECQDMVTVALNKAIAETGKYSVKASDYLFPKDDNLTDYAVKHLARALQKKRLFALGGIFDEASKALKLEDAMDDNADLIHITSDDAINPTLAYYVVKFRWGGSLYKTLSFNVVAPSD